MRSTYRILAHLVALGVVVQAAAVAFGAFGVWNDVDAGLLIDNNYEGNAGLAIHSIVGLMVMPALGLLLLITSFFAKVPGGVKWGALVFLAIVVQFLLGGFAFELPALGALHGINALIIFALAIVAGRSARTAATSQTDDADVARV